MEIVRSWQDVPPARKGASVALGNFDGVHRGHQAVIRAARDARPDLPPGVVTFEPHPREYFAPQSPPFRLMNAEARANRLGRLGVARLYELPFGPDLAAMEAEDFVTRVLGAGLGVGHVTVGADFCFGKGRRGTAAMLAETGRAAGFGTTILPLVGGSEGAISSSAIRAALSEGRLGDAAAMLGHRHRIDGPVIHGEKRGRTLGYPTANMSLKGLHLPRFGVYAVRVAVLDGPHRGDYGGVASLGVRPMFRATEANLETFVFDFSGDLYGAHLSVALIEFLRPEARFDSLQALIAQMDADSRSAREVLARAG